MTRSEATQRLLILGGGGMVGIQVAREAARELRPAEIVLSALMQHEVDEAISLLSEEAKSEGWNVSFSGVAGDIFVPESLQGIARGDLVGRPEAFDVLFDDIFSPDPDAYRRSALYQLLMKHRPDVVVDCINTATAISYQDVYTTSRRVKVMLDRLEAGEPLEGEGRDRFIRSIRELLIAQGVPQITRHILFLHQALKESSVRVYVKVGTTGTGGMGINIPYTHSEEKPSATLLAKSAIGFAHTGLLFLLARTPGAVFDGEEAPAALIKEIKPGAMIGFKRLGPTHVRLAGPGGGRQPGYLLEPQEELLGDSIQPRADWDSYRRFEGRDVPVRMVGADTGENGFFSIGEFQAITYPRQMEYVTPEEVARTVVLEILGAATGRDVLAAIDGSITDPSYRAGVLRHHASWQLEKLEEALAAEDSEVLPSIAIGHLGPPRLSKLLIESYLIRAAVGSSAFGDLLAISAEEMRLRVVQYLEANPRIASLIVTIGIPILQEDGERVRIRRGPRLNIPVPRPDDQPVGLDQATIDRLAFLGWVDLREANFTIWRDRIDRISRSGADIVTFGSAAFDAGNYIPESFRPGDVVGWLLTNETDESGMVGRRLY